MILQTGSYFPFYELTDADRRVIHALYWQQYAANNNKLNDKTVYARKNSKLAGIAGELAFSRYVGKDAQYVGDTSRTIDFITKGGTVDVKTKLRSMPPRPDFDGSIWGYANNQVDYYAFLSVMEDLQMVWFCGFMTKKEFLTHDQRHRWLAGETDNSNGLEFAADTISLNYKHMRQFTLR